MKCKQPLRSNLSFELLRSTTHDRDVENIDPDWLPQSMMFKRTPRRGSLQFYVALKFKTRCWTRRDPSRHLYQAGIQGLLPNFTDWKHYGNKLRNVVMVSGNDLPSLWTYVRDRTLLPPPPVCLPQAETASIANFKLGRSTWFRSSEMVWRGTSHYSFCRRYVDGAFRVYTGLRQVLPPSKMDTGWL